MSTKKPKQGCYLSTSKAVFWDFMKLTWKFLDIVRKQDEDINVSKTSEVKMDCPYKVVLVHNRNWTNLTRAKSKNDVRGEPTFHWKFTAGPCAGLLQIQSAQLSQESRLQLHKTIDRSQPISFCQSIGSS